MACWTVLEPPDAAPGSFEAADRSVFVKDGWSWGAFLAAPVWLLWRRMWVVFLAWLALMVLLSVVTKLLGGFDAIGTAVSIGSGLWLAVEGNALRRWTLMRRGWRLSGLAMGCDVGDAEESFFTRRDHPPRRIAPETPEMMGKPLASVSSRQGENPESKVLGVFPEPALPEGRSRR